MTPIPEPKSPEQAQPETQTDRPILVRQPDDSLVLFGPSLDDFNLCDDPC